MYVVFIIIKKKNSEIKKVWVRYIKYNIFIFRKYYMLWILIDI